MINILSVFCEIPIRWMPQHLTDHSSTLVQVMAWCRQATSHYLSQCWPRPLSPYDVTGPQWVKKMVELVTFIMVYTINLVADNKENIKYQHKCPFVKIFGLPLHRISNAKSVSMPWGYYVLPIKSWCNHKQAADYYLAKELHNRVIIECNVMATSSCVNRYQKYSGMS